MKKLIVALLSTMALAQTAQANVDVQASVKNQTNAQTLPCKGLQGLENRLPFELNPNETGLTRNGRLVVSDKHKPGAQQ